ncbi:MAG: dihydrodipicolinate synthase family protein [Deltaproteobacteria bacterium]|nr:dihydrodipicolinate synthase family protein [Deltaproteobacteria bacterium]
MPLFKGLVATPITSFDENENIYEAGVRNVINYLHSHGIRNLFCIGSWGGFAMMSSAERMKVAEIQISECKAKGMKLIVNVSCPYTKEAIRLARHAQEHGADAVVTLSPYYYTQYGYNDDNILYYLSELVEAVDIPVHYYNNTRTTGVILTIDLFKKFLDIGIMGMKEGGGNLATFIEMMGILKEKDIDFDMIPSSVTMFVNGLLNGVKATMIGSAMVFPEVAVHAYEAFQAGDMDETIKLHLQLMDLRRILGSKGFSPATCYGLLRLRGVDVGRPRRPWLDLSDKDLEDIKQSLKIAGLTF